MIAGRILLGLLAVLHFGMLFFFVIGLAGTGYRSSVGPDYGVAFNASAILLLAILIGSALANLKLILHTATVVVVASLIVILLNDIKIELPLIPSLAVACLPISGLWLWFYARVAWFR